MNAIHTWGYVYDGGAILVIYPQGEESSHWNKREVPIPEAQRTALYAEMEALALDRYADTPTLDSFI